jgi:hypothetical protein
MDLAAVVARMRATEFFPLPAGATWHCCTTTTERIIM